MKERIRKVKRELHSIVRSYGFKVVYAPSNIMDGCGYFDQHAKIVRVYISHYKFHSRRLALYTLAHEVRHLIHFQTGLYYDYYKPEHPLMMAQIYKTGKVPKRYNPPNIGVAVRAERDCDQWAFNLLEPNNIPLTKTLLRRKNTPYPASMTMGYDVRFYIRRKRVRRNKA